jgi:zinc/manganese transport system substrate-binding protein
MVDNENENDFQYALAPMTARTALAGLAAALALVAAGCGEDDAGSASGIEVVATTPVAADLARNVAGDRASVVALMAPNTDPHAYEVRPRDVEALAQAGLVVRSGGDLDEWLQEAVEGSGSDAPTLTLIDHVRTREGGHADEEEEHAGEEEAEDEHAGEEEAGEAEIDPHWWQDPRNAERAVTALRDALAQADPDGASDYRANADAYVAKIRELDRAAEACIDQVPTERRKLVTTHDAFGYYAERYGIEVIGTVIPAVTTEGQPSAGETAELVETIRDEGVETIFAESSVDQKIEEAIARESGATVGAELWADTLGPQGSSGATYLQSIAANTRALVDGFTGGEHSCSLPS